jgi:predicted lipid-binding transport protein (Tim44 family)
LLSIFLPKWAGGFVTFEIILLAMVAAFLGLRLYSVLGKRTGHEQDPLVREPVEERQVPAVRLPLNNAEPAPARISVADVDVDIAAQSGLRAIMNADRQFDSELFLQGAKSAYQAILEAFWKGDKVALEFLCDDDVFQSFAGAIDGREERGEVMENRLVRIETARILEASFDHPMARITVRFDSDIAALVKDKDGNVIGGSMSDAEEAHDVWTFMRDIKSTDRNWKLDETDEA